MMIVDDFCGAMGFSWNSQHGTGIGMEWHGICFHSLIP